MPGLKPQPRRHDFTAAANRVAEITRTENGCISYEFFADINRRGRMLLFEEWESEEALAKLELLDTSENEPPAKPHRKKK